MSVLFRMCKREDLRQVISMIKELADYEKMSDQMVGRAEDLEKSIFINKECEVLLATLDDEIIGYSLFFNSYSTFLCKAGMYVEDFYIKKEHRKQGYGLAMFKTLARISKARDYQRMDWACLKWNDSALEFYLNNLKAKKQDEWFGLRLNHDEIEELAKID